MKKKSLITMLVALTLVAVVGVGATLAYLSSTTGTLTNTFTVGKVSITQDESDESTPDDDTDRTETGNKYDNIQPGDTLVKDPTVTVLPNSSDCYVFMKLSGADALVNSFVVQDDEDNDVNAFSFDGFNDNNWVKVYGENNTLDGVYRYTSVVTNSKEKTVLPALFTSVKYSIFATELPDTVELKAVEIVSCAVQSDNMNEQTALEAALDEME